MNKIELMSFQVITSCHNKVREQPQSQTRQELPQHVLIFVTTKHVVEQRWNPEGTFSSDFVNNRSQTDTLKNISDLCLYLEHILLGRASHIL